MKKIKFACNLSLLTLFALGQWACEWDPYEHDSDRRQAVASRQRLLARAADQGWWVAGAHLPFPCIGHVRREGRAGYAWVPAEFGPARVAP